MTKPLFFLLIALAALASCKQGYQSKNQVEETLLGVARDSLGHRGEITIFDFAFIDTFTHYRKDYEDSIRAVFPHSVDLVASYDSLEKRNQRVSFLMDSIFEIGWEDASFSKQLSAEHSKLSEESDANYDVIFSLGRLMQRYKWMLASGQDPFVFIAGECGYMHEGEYQGVYFVLSGDGKKVLMYRDVLKHLEKIQKDR